MKFPLSENVFPLIQLTPEQCVELEQLTESVLDEALDEYDAYTYQQKRQLSKLQWKALKKRDNIAVYSERSGRGYVTTRPALAKSTSVSDLTASGSGSTFDFTASISALDFTESGSSRMVFTSPVSRVSTTIAAAAALSVTGQRKLPKLLAVGTVPSTVEDMVYGMSAPTPTHAMIKSAYMQDDVLDAKVLYEIKSPTPDDPLRFLGLKWLVKGHSSAISTLVRPRDFVFVESVGITTRANGVRVGYVVTHSVDLRECRELTELSIVRARIASCSLFRQRSSGPVDVFMKSYAEPNGNVPDAVALRSAANSLVSVAQADWCAHNRKMGWEVTQRLRDPTRRSRGSPIVTSDSACSTCAKSFSRFSAAFTCLFCASLVCAKCREQRELTIPLPSTKAQAARSAKRVTRTTVDGCKRCCATTFRYQDAEAVAKQEILEGEYGSVVVARASSSGSWSPTAVSEPVRDHNTGTRTSTRGQKVGRKMTAGAVGTRRANDGDARALPWPRTAFSKHMSLEDIGAHLLTPPAKDSSPSGAISVDDVTVSDLSLYDLEELEDLFTQPSSTSSTLSAADLAAPVKPFATGGDAKLERKDSVIELKRDDGEWLPSARAGAGASQPKSDDLYQRITELHQTAESLYRYTKRTTETVLSASVATGPSQLARLTSEDDE